MLTIFGKPHARGGFCDGVTRRDFLTIGGTLLGGCLALPQPARGRGAGRRQASSHKAIIKSFCRAGRRTSTCGTSSRTPRRRSAASSSRSRPTSPASRSASCSRASPQMMDKFAIIRSLVGSRRRPRRLPVHDRPQARRRSRTGGWPSLGAWVSKLQGPVNPAVPPHVTLMYPTGERRWGDPGDGGFLGMAHAPFSLVGGKDTA